MTLPRKIFQLTLSAEEHTFFADREFKNYETISI